MHCTLYRPAHKPITPNPISLAVLRDVDTAIAAVENLADAIRALGDADDALRRAGYALAFTNHTGATADADELADFIRDFRAELLANELFAIQVRAAGALHTAPGLVDAL